MFHFRFLAAANAISAYGNFLNMLALSLFTYHVTGSALHTGLFMALRLGSGVLAGFQAGAVVTRFPRKTVMVWSGLAQAGAMGILLLTPTAFVHVTMYAVALITGVAGTLYAVALRSAVPEIVGADARTTANSILVLGRSVAMVAGFASSGLIIAFFDYLTVFALNAATFVVSSAIVAALPIKTGERREKTEPKPGFRSSHKTALEYLKVNRVPAWLIVIRTLIGLASAAANVSIPIYSSSVDADSPEAFMAQFWTAWAVGNIATQLGLTRLVKRTGRQIGARTFVIAACVMSLASIGIFAGWPVVPTVIASVVTGAASGLADTAYQSRLQEAPDKERGYLFGLSMTSENLSFGVGMVVAAAFLDHVHPLPIVAAMSLVALGSVAGFIAAVRRSDRRQPADLRSESA